MTKQIARYRTLVKSTPEKHYTWVGVDVVQELGLECPEYEDMYWRVTLKSIDEESAVMDVTISDPGQIDYAPVIYLAIILIIFSLLMYPWQ